MNTTAKRFMASALFAIAGIANANPVLVTSDAPTWLPGSPPEGWTLRPYAAGSWYNQSQSGSGWAIERFQPLAGQTQPFYSGTLYTYDNAGNPYWLLMTGTFEPASWQTLFSTGEIGRITGPLFDGQGGACLGCNYIAPTVEESPFGTGTLVWQGIGNHMQVFSNGQYKETVMPSAHNLFGDALSNFAQVGYREEYTGSGANGGKIYRDTHRFTQITCPAWLGNLSAGDAQVARIPQISTSICFSDYQYPTNDQLVIYDSADNTLIHYSFVMGQETLSGNTRTAYRLSSSDAAGRIVMVNSNSFVDFGYLNTTSQSAQNAYSRYVGTSRTIRRYIKEIQ